MVWVSNICPCDKPWYEPCINGFNTMLNWTIWFTPIYLCCAFSLSLSVSSSYQTAIDSVDGMIFMLIIWCRLVALSSTSTFVCKRREWARHSEPKSCGVGIFNVIYMKRKMDHKVLYDKPIFFYYDTNTIYENEHAKSRYKALCLSAWSTTWPSSCTETTPWLAAMSSSTYLIHRHPTVPYKRTTT